MDGGRRGIVAIDRSFLFLVVERTRLRSCFELDCSKEGRQGTKKGTLRGGPFSEPDSMLGNEMMLIDGLDERMKEIKKERMVASK